LSAHKGASIVAMYPGVRLLRPEDTTDRPGVSGEREEAGAPGGGYLAMTTLAARPATPGSSARMK
jgi:hypothetical protein